MGEEEKKEEEKKEEEEIVLKVEMHCEACARKIARSLRGFQGVEEVTADCKASKVVVKGKTADPIKVCERIQRKSGKKVEIISPLPKPPTQEDKAKEEETKEPQEEKKDQPPAVVTVVLKVGMHCDACAQALQKRIRKIQGVESVTTDIANDQVMVTGIIDPTKLVDDVYKKTRKQASIVVNKEEEKKDNDNNQQKPEAVQKKEEEEKKEEVKEEEELLHEHQNMMMEIKKNEHWPSKYMDLHHHYAYPTQIFSDENPHACSLM